MHAAGGAPRPHHHARALPRLTCTGSVVTYGSTTNAEGGGSGMGTVLPPASSMAAGMASTHACTACRGQRWHGDAAM